MTIHLYTALWNEARILEFFFTHYDGWVDRYFVYDDGSTDGTLEILKRHPKVSVRRLERTHEDSLALSLTDFWNDAWKGSRGEADLVVLAELDEHVFHPHIAEYLAARHAAGITAFPALGYQMLSETFPEAGTHLATTHRQGATFDAMNKLAIFDPNALSDVNFKAGRHVAEPAGRVVYPDRDEILLLHYKFLSFPYYCDREQELATRLEAFDRATGMAFHYLRANDERAAIWADFSTRLVDVTGGGRDHHARHPWDRWWREPDPAPRRERLQEAIRKEPACASFHVELGLELLRTGDLAGAESALRRGLELRPRATEACDALARVLKRQGRMAEALEAAAKAVSLAPDRNDLGNRFGLLLSDVGRFEDAAEAHRAVLARSPDNAYAWFGLSRALDGLDKISGAIEAGQRAVAAAPDHPPFRAHLVAMRRRASANGGALRQDAQTPES